MKYKIDNINEIVDKIRSALLKFPYSTHIKYAILFGSTIHDSTHHESDIDVLVRVDEKSDIINLVVELTFFISKELCVKEDYVDILPIKKKNDVPYDMLYDIYTNGITIIINDRDTYHRDFVRAISLYCDLQIFLRKHNAVGNFLRILRG